jgi:spore coat polysaccharide biosynthesis protein SpsF
MSTTAVIIQARMGSSRLPGKVMERLDDRTVLDHVVSRALRIARADAVCIATTVRPTDDPVAEAAAAAGAAVFRGDETDVLARYLGAAEMLDATVVMRVTSDCPLIDPEVCDAVLALRAERRADYAANNLEREWPHGLDCEAFTRAALAEAARTATDAYDREHVTPWLRRAPHLVRAHLPGPGLPAAARRWTLDYPEDLAFFRALLAARPAAANEGWQAIHAFLAGRPEIVAINAGRTTGR